MVHPAAHWGGEHFMLMQRGSLSLQWRSFKQSRDSTKYILLFFSLLKEGLGWFWNILHALVSVLYAKPIILNSTVPWFIHNSNIYLTLCKNIFTKTYPFDASIVVWIPHSIRLEMVVVLDVLEICSRNKIRLWLVFFSWHWYLQILSDQFKQFSFDLQLIIQISQLCRMDLTSSSPEIS